MPSDRERNKQKYKDYVMGDFLDRKSRKGIAGDPAFLTGNESDETSFGIVEDGFRGVQNIVRGTFMVLRAPVTMLTKPEFGAREFAKGVVSIGVGALGVVTPPIKIADALTLRVVVRPALVLATEVSRAALLTGRQAILNSVRGRVRESLEPTSTPEEVASISAQQENNIPPLIPHATPLSYQEARASANVPFVEAFPIVSDNRTPITNEPIMATVAVRTDTLPVAEAVRLDPAQTLTITDQSENDRHPSPSAPSYSEYIQKLKMEALRALLPEAPTGPIPSRQVQQVIAREGTVAEPRREIGH